MFREWLRLKNLGSERKFYLINNEICMDYFIRYESLESGIEHVCNLLGIPFCESEIPRLKTGKRNHSISFPEFYNDESVRIVREKYKFELDYFGYDFPG